MESSQKSREKRRRKSSVAIKILTAITIVLALLCIVKLFVLDVYTVDGMSMSPTYEDGQRVFARKVGGANRFDAVIIKNAQDYFDSGMQSQASSRLFKRVVAVAGDVVWSEDGVLCVWFDGEEHRYDQEDYGGGELDTMFKRIDRQTVPQGKVFVLGDNRNDSTDSRTFGFVDTDDIEAVVI